MKADFHYCNSTLDIYNRSDLDTLKYKHSCHPVNHQYFQVPQFGEQLYWHSLSAPQARASLQVTLCCLQEHLLEHLLIPHPHLTNSTTDSGVIAMSNRIGTEILSASQTILP